MIKQVSKTLLVVVITLLMVGSFFVPKHTSLLSKNMNWDDDRHGAKPTKMAHLQWDSQPNVKEKKEKEKEEDKIKEKKNV